MKETTFKEIKDMIKQLVVLNKETDERLDKRIKETDERLDKRIKETDGRLDKRYKELCKEIGGISGTQGEIAEDLIYRNVLGLLEERGMEVKEININIKKSREYDIIVKNGKEIVLVEVKNKVSADDIKNFLTKQIPSFKKDFPEYKNKTIFGGIGGLVFKPSIEKCAEDKGLYVITQNGEGGATIANKKKFKPTAL